ncbi:MAG TPA: protein kinase, partial [Polyangiaceae bacterium]|nr:protein kinase [Polyangiaceae bacterium]
GVVYEVEHVHTGEQLALKLLHSTWPGDGAPSAPLSQPPSFDASLIARFQREARAAAKIRSEHVVRVTDAGLAPELGNAPYFVMEQLDGLDLERLVERRGALSPSAVVSVLAQVARALDRAHSLGIVHRDLKPENLYLHRKEDGAVIVKILDFGISRFATDQGDPQNLFVTKDGTLLGTPFYMAPEQARGRVHETGPAADVWAIGIIALRLLTARAYWSANTLAELMVQILSEPMPPPSVRFPELGTRLDAWFFRSCDREPSRRFASAGEQVRALSQALSVPIADEQLTQSLVRLMGNELELVVRQSEVAPIADLSRTATYRQESGARALPSSSSNPTPNSLSPSAPATLVRSGERAKSPALRVAVIAAVAVLSAGLAVSWWLGRTRANAPLEARPAAIPQASPGLPVAPNPTRAEPAVEPLPDNAPAPEQNSAASNAPSELEPRTHSKPLLQSPTESSAAGAKAKPGAHAPVFGKPAPTSAPAKSSSVPATSRTSTALKPPKPYDPLAP